MGTGGQGRRTRSPLRYLALVCLVVAAALTPWPVRAGFVVAALAQVAFLRVDTRRRPRVRGGLRPGARRTGDGR